MIPDIDVNIPSNKSDSSEDITRTEMMWRDTHEQQLRRWRDIAEYQVGYHRKRYKCYRWLYIMITLPSVVLPVVASTFADKLSSHTSAMLLCGTGIINGISSALNIGRRAESHSLYDSYWDSYIANIDMELSKPKSGRVACDVYLQKSLDRYMYLNQTSPS